MTTLSVGGAIKAAIVATPDLSALNGQVYRDHAPDAATMPYITFIEPLADAQALAGDAKVLFRTELVQVDLWQKQTTETDALRDALAALLDGADLASSTKQVLRCRLYDSKRLPEDEYQVVHQTFTLHVTHAN